jgi:hypothetical protein
MCETLRGFAKKRKASLTEKIRSLPGTKAYTAQGERATNNNSQ